MKIDVSILSSALSKMIEHAEQMRGSEIDVDYDYYWFIPKEELIDPEKEPANLTIGSLEDDWENISALARGEKEAFGYMLVWASSILRALGDRTM